MKRYRTLSTVVFLTFSALILSCGQPTYVQGEFMGRGAGIGALLGFALSDGYFPEDVIADTIGGAAAGAAVGGVADVAAETGRAREEAYRVNAEQQRQLAEQQRQLQDIQREMNEANKEEEEAETAIINAIGNDNWEGYKALRGCQHDRSYALAQAGRTSGQKQFQLASIWLEAMVAVDQKDKSRSDSAFQMLVEQDPDIDTVQQASLKTDQAVLGMRDERKELGIKCM